MSTSILDQELITLAEATREIPTRPHIATIWRWANRGVRGHRLQTWLVGGQRFTSVSAIENFLAAINGGSAVVQTSSSRQRQRDIDQAEKELAQEGI